MLHKHFFLKKQHKLWSDLYQEVLKYKFILQIARLILGYNVVRDMHNVIRITAGHVNSITKQAKTRVSPMCLHLNMFHSHKFFPLRGDKVSMLTHTYPHKPLRNTEVTICNHQTDSPL